MTEEAWGTSELRTEAPYLSFARFDARGFDGALTRGIVDAYVDTDTPAVLSGGVGTAELEMALAAETNWQVRAVDLHKGVIENARGDTLPENLTVDVGDIRHPDRTDHYDVNLQYGSLQELVGSPLEGFRGVADSLRSGGVAVVVVPNLRNVLRIVDDDYIVLDATSLDGDGVLASTELHLENGDVVEQYGFTHEAQSFDDDLPGFDPATLTTIERIAAEAGLEPAAIDPLREWTGAANSPIPDSAGIDLDLDDGFPIPIPVDPGGLIGEDAEKTLQEVTESFDREAVEPLVEEIESVGLEAYRRSQARNPEIGPRADLYIFRKFT